MPEIKDDKLFVNLGASQARRRLKGFGHGVRKIQTAGKNRVVIIHTAVGLNLEELQRQFVDVGFSTCEMDFSKADEDLPIQESEVDSGSVDSNS